MYAHLGQLDRQTAKPLHGGQETGDLVDPARTVKVGLGLHETTCAVRSKPVTSRRRKRCSHPGGVHQPQLLKPSQSARNGGKPTPRKLAGSPVETNGNSQTPRSALESSALSLRKCQSFSNPPNAPTAFVHSSVIGAGVNESGRTCQGLYFKNRCFTRFWPPSRGVSWKILHSLRVSRPGAPRINREIMGISAAFCFRTGTEVAQSPAGNS